MSTTQEARAPGTAIKGMDLVGCTVQSAEKVIGFYRDVLGMKVTMMSEDGRGAEFELADGSTFGVWQPDGEYPLGMGIMFAVDDVDAAVKAARERGATLSDPMEGPVCFMAFGEDPEGNRFMIHKRKA